MQLLNPFSVQLDKQPFMNITSEPIFSKGDYKIYKYYEKYFVHTFKNIVIAERCAKNEQMINDLISGIYTGIESQKYFQFDRPKEAIEIGINAAKKLNFKIQ